MASQFLILLIDQPSFFLSYQSGVSPESLPLPRTVNEG